ncbi:MAG: NAD(P)/FAD-dependent oxidoreductase [Alphaproteobacteria bacterium]
MSEAYDAIVIGGGVVGASTAFHLKTLGAERVLLLEREQICAGGTAKSCAIVRSHYSIPTNTQLALKSLEMFADFKAALGDDEADAGFVNSGYLILAPEGETADKLVANLDMQAGVGAETQAISREEAKERHPWLALDDVAAVGFEPRSGYADPYLTTTSFANAARKLGVEIKPLRAALGLTRDGERVTGVETYAETFAAGAVIAAIGPWSGVLERWTGIALPLELSRHTVLTFRVAALYDPALPVVKDLTTANKMYFRPTRDSVTLVGIGDHGDPVATPDEAEAGIVGMDFVARQGEQLARRMPAYTAAEFCRSWTGPYDITPDWNPVLGPLPGIAGLHVAFGFSGHGFKLAPALGRVLAQSALGLETEVDLLPYRFTRFAEGDLLAGAYGVGSIS